MAKILNHTWADRQIKSVYGCREKLPEMLQVLERWASKLERIATELPATVVRIQ